MYIWLDVTTRYGRTSIRITNGLYERAMATPKGKRSKAQDSICIRVRENLVRSTGRRIRFLGWSGIDITDVREEGQELRRAERRQRDRERQPLASRTMRLVTPDGATLLDGDEICGCMPS